MFYLRRIYIYVHVRVIHVIYITSCGTPFDVSTTLLPQWPTLCFLLISIIYIHITPNTIYYYSHTFSLIIYTFSVMCTALCYNPIYYWALSIYNYFNLIPKPLCQSHTLLSYTCNICVVKYYI